MRKKKVEATEKTRHRGGRSTKQAKASKPKGKRRRVRHTAFAVGVLGMTEGGGFDRAREDQLLVECCVWVRLRAETFARWIFVIVGEA